MQHCRATLLRNSKAYRFTTPLRATRPLTIYSPLQASRKANEQSPFKAQHASKGKKTFKQSPSESNITASQSSPQATEEYVKGTPEPDSTKKSYEAANPEDAHSAWEPSSTGTAPAHQSATNERRLSSKDELEKEGTQQKVPPDFNTDHIGKKAPDWPGKKEEMKEQK